MIEAERWGAHPAHRAREALGLGDLVHLRVQRSVSALQAALHRRPLAKRAWKASQA